MPTEENHETYYVPHSSWLPIFASLGLFLTVYGGGHILNDMTAGEAHSSGTWILLAGGLITVVTLFAWFRKVIEEDHARLYSAQVNRTYVWSMWWFIYSEAMFFLAFFGALFYIRYFVVGWLGGEGERGPSDMLWPEYSPEWPMLNTPDPSKYPGAKEAMGPWGLPLINTIILVTSSVTVTFAHHGINENKRSKLVNWLAVTVLLGVLFLGFQVYEYYHAYTAMGLTLNAGIYGTTFFMLTGFHGAHVTLGTIMLLVMLLRAMKGHFTADNCFGFEASVWYWHFVDVVWLGLFLFVYIMGS